MGMISREQAEWAVVDRFRQMLEDPQGAYLASQSYALFSSILCWVLQHIRIHQAYQFTDADRAAGALLAELENEQVTAEPWGILSDPAARIVVGGVAVPSPENFENHNAARFLINLRDAMAHGDARNVKPFNHGELLLGFSFDCSELKRGRVVWKGRIVLLRSDMRKIGSALAARYCDKVKAADAGGQLESRAAGMVEAAA